MWYNLIYVLTSLSNKLTLMRCYTLQSGDKHQHLSISQPQNTNTEAKCCSVRAVEGSVMQL